MVRGQRKQYKKYLKYFEGNEGGYLLARKGSVCVAWVLYVYTNGIDKLPVDGGQDW